MRRSAPIPLATGRGGWEEESLIGVGGGRSRDAFIVEKAGTKTRRLRGVLPLHAASIEKRQQKNEPPKIARSVANRLPAREEPRSGQPALLPPTERKSSNCLLVNALLPDARTRLIAIIGDPVTHSVSPRAQSFALSQIGENALCLAFQVSPPRLQNAVKSARELGLAGLMVTIPHKQVVLEWCDELHPSARLVGAANLLEFRADGTTCGHSSDGWAALESLKSRGVEVRGAHITILGGGGSARSLALSFADAGAASIEIWNRTPERAQAIADEVRSRLGVEAVAPPLPVGDLSRADIIINTTSIGMTPDTGSSPLDSAHIDAHHTVFDIVYNPLETRLLREAAQRGAKTVDGLDMVLWTNVYAARVCLGVELRIEDLRAEARRALESNR